ncbi:MAG: hypothetical protein LWW93_15355 [Hyphomicrobiales bacterium]|nr:hypothetical protein [Hyphomicrobiales bacterium]
MAVVSYNAYSDDDSIVTPQTNLAPEGGPRVTVRAGNSGGVIDAYTGQFTALGVASVNTGHFTDSGKGYDIRSATGSPINGREAKDSDIVTINGVETTYGVARRTGLITEEGGKAPEEKVEKAPERTAEVELMDAPTEALMTELAAVTQPSTQVAALSDFTDTGVVSDDAVNRLASEAGIHPTDMRAKVDTIMAGFQKQADTAIAGFSNDHQAVYEWARKTDPAGLKRATQELAMMGSTKGFKSIGARYLETADKHSPGEVEALPWAEGVRCVRQDGHIVVHYPGGSDRWSVLIKTGRAGSLMTARR